ncbi:MAG: TrkA family potassium uptake protein [Firmicutes bacterium]|jgi:trk system potassium uptake protein TrkA|nr:TrkA family potassium uptake protein [Bacillota bacterium]
MKKKQFVVIGCGRFGTSVATQLYDMGFEVMAVDKSEETIQNLADKVTYAVQADAIDENSLSAIGIRNFDVAVITIGADIQSSILVTLMVKELGVKTVVAKAQNELHGKVLYRIGADRVVFPEREMGIRIAKNLVSDNILEYIQLAPDYSIMEVKALDPWIGKNLMEIDMRSKYGINVMAIKHNDDINIAVMATDIIKENDVLVVIGHNDDLNRLEEK